MNAAWNEPRPPNIPGRTWHDWALVAVLVSGAVVEGLVRPDLPSRITSVILMVALAPTLLWRRSQPLAMVAITFTACAVAPLFLGHELGNHAFAFLLVLVFALFRWGSGREMLAGSAIVAGKIGLSGVLGHLGAADVVAGFVVVSLAAALGLALRFRARARARELEQAKLLERERLARDLHDTVAHHVSAMAIRAQAGLETLSSNPSAAADALRVIENEATHTLAEMRTMVRALRRDEPAELAPAPGVRELDRLVSAALAGPVVSVELTGDVDGLPPTVGTAVYRLAQEAITNARRHARHATRITVRVTAEDSCVRLQVSDDGEASPARAPGYGLIGMGERAGLLGGTFEAGPSPDRGWAVTAVLPRAVS